MTPSTAGDILAQKVTPVIERLERTDCSFPMCPGPDVEPVAMMTCTICLSIIDLRALRGALEWMG